MDKQIPLSSNSSYQYDFLKVTVLNHSFKGEIASSTLFVEHPIHSPLEAKGEQK